MSIAHSLYKTVVDQDNQVHDHNLRYHLLCFLTPALMVILVNAFGAIEDYKSDILWCWISNDGSWKDSILRSVSLYIPLWIVIIYNIYAYYKIILTIKQEERYMSHQADIKMQLVKRLRMYPIVLILCYSLTSAYRLMQLIDPSVSPHFFLKFIAALFSTLAGFLHSALYGFNPVVRNALCKCWKLSLIHI